jgi:hydrogenase maturation protease
MSTNGQTILVAGVGNIFLGDDAFGVEVVQQLAGRKLPAEVCVTDFGIRSYDLAYALMEAWELVILVDALPRGGAPGTIYTVEAELPNADSRDAAPALDAHSMNPVAVLRMVAQLGGHLNRLLVVGCEPEGVEPDENGRIGLSSVVEAAVDESIRVIEELVAKHLKTLAA